MTIKERKVQEAGFCAGRVLVRVRVLPEGEEKPEDAVEVSDEVAPYDWKPEEVN